MALVGKQEVDLEIQSPPDKLFNLIRSEIHHLPNVSFDKVHAVELHEGDWHIHGCVKLWTFTIDGKVETLRDKVEIDDENKSITFVALEGDIFKQYKSYQATIQVVPKGESSLAKIIENDVK